MSTKIMQVHPILPEPQVKQNAAYWEMRYKSRNIQWHIDQVHPQLLRYMSQLTQTDTNKPLQPEKKLKFFMPLCGKSKDIPFLLNLGYEVFGVECVTSIIDEFMEECNLDLKYDANRLLYHNKDESLKLYCGDLFKCPIEQYGPFDCVWDRASFIALNYPFRNAYVDVMKRAVAHETNKQHDFRYLLHTVNYDKSKPGGPPHSVDSQDIHDYFVGCTKVSKLERNWGDYDHPMRRAARYFNEDFYEEFYMIEPKK